MPTIRDKRTGEVYQVEWNEDRPPTYQEKLQLIEQAKSKVSFPSSAPDTRNILRKITEPIPELQRRALEASKAVVHTGDPGREFANLPNIGPFANREVRAGIRGSSAGIGEGLANLSPLDIAGMVTGGLASGASRLLGTGSKVARTLGILSGATAAPEIAAGGGDIISAQDLQNPWERASQTAGGAARMALGTVGTVAAFPRKGFNPQQYQEPIGPPKPPILDENLDLLDEIINRKYPPPEALLPEEIRLPELQKDIISPAGERQRLEPVREVPGLVITPEEDAILRAKRPYGPVSKVERIKEPFVGKPRLRDFHFQEAINEAVGGKGGIATPEGEFYPRPRVSSRLTMPTRGNPLRDKGRFTGFFEEIPGKRVALPDIDRKSAQNLSREDRVATEVASKISKELELELTKTTKKPSASGAVVFDEKGVPRINGKRIMTSAEGGLGITGESLNQFVKDAKKFGTWLKENYKGAGLDDIERARMLLRFLAENPDQSTGKRITDRMLGTNKRAQGTAPRDIGLAPRQQTEFAKALEAPLPETANPRAKALEEMISDLGGVSPEELARGGVFFKQGRSTEPTYLGKKVDAGNLKEGEAIIQVLSDGTAQIYQGSGPRDALERFARSASGRAITAKSRKRISDLSELDRQIDLVSPKGRKKLEDISDLFKGEEGFVLNPFVRRRKVDLGDLDERIKNKFGSSGIEVPTETKRTATGMEKLVDVLNIPRTLKSTADLSMPLRQGLLAVSRHPILTGKNLWPMIKSMGSEKAFDEVAKEIGSRPNFELYKNSGLALTQHPKHIKTGQGLDTREEAFLSTIPERTPGIGDVVRGSNRAAVTFLNKTRADLFDLLMTKYSKLNITPESDPDFYKGVAKYINIVTGRGTLGKYGERITPALQSIFYSPRFQGSRIQSMTQSLPGRHILYKALHNEKPKGNEILPVKIQNELRKDLAATALEIGTILFGAAKWAGYDVSWDPTDPVGLKIKHKNTTLDLGGGFNQYLRYLTSMATGKGYVAGRKKDMRQRGKPFSHTGSLTYNLTRSKLNPPAALLETMRTGRNYQGQRFNFDNPEHWKREMGDMVSPMFPRDVHEMWADPAMKKSEVKDLAFMTIASILGNLGASVSTRTEEDRRKMKEERRR